MRDAVRPGPSASGSGARNVANLAAIAGGQSEVDTAASASEGFEAGRAGFVVGASDAAGGAGKGDVCD